MKKFEYTIKDELGIHARPAGTLVKKVAAFSSEITLECKGKSASAKKLFSVMSLGAKCGDLLTVTVSGDDEDQAATELQEFIEANL